MKIQYKSFSTHTSTDTECIVKDFSFSKKPDVIYKTESGLECDIFFIKVKEKNAFNSSFISFSENKYIYIYRNNDQSISSCYLNKNYDVISDCFDFNMSWNMEPRVFIFKERLLLQTTFCNNWQDRTELWELDATDEKIRIRNRVAIFDTIMDFPGYKKGREKNWMPFVKNDKLFFIYSVCPHRILLYNEEEKSVRLFFDSPWKNKTKWMYELRGNAVPVRLDENYYLSTFHNPDHSFGFYTFESNPPYRVVKYSKFPVFIRRDGRNITERKLFYAPYLFFPLGMEIEKDIIKLSAGINDIKTCMIHLKISDILSSLECST